MALNKKHHPSVARIDLMHGQFGTILGSLNREREAHEHLGVFVYRRCIDHQQGLYQYSSVRPRDGGKYAITTWEVPAHLDVLRLVSKASDELNEALLCLAGLREHGAGELVDDLMAYIGATQPWLYEAMFGKVPQEVEVPRQVGHLTIIK